MNIWSKSATKFARAVSSRVFTRLLKKFMFWKAENLKFFLVFFSGCYNEFWWSIHCSKGDNVTFRGRSRPSRPRIALDFFCWSETLMQFRFLCYNGCMVLLQWVRISWNHHFESFSGFQCPNRFDFFVLIRSTHKVLFFCYKGVWICYNGTKYHEIDPWSRFQHRIVLDFWYWSDS